MVQTGSNFLCSALAATLAATTLVPLALTATETAALPDEPAEVLVAEALHREIYGADRERAALLEAALHKDPDLASARWQLGYLKHRGEWTSVDQLPDVMRSNPLWDAYYLQRSRNADDFQGNLDLADWCRKRKLETQERAHLTRALDFAPDHREIRRRLGHTLEGGEWKTPEEVRDAERKEEEARASVARWRGELGRIRNSLRSRDEERIRTAKTRLRELASVELLPALESVFCSSDATLALLAVDAMAIVAGKEAAEHLIRQAVLSQWPEVRVRASTLLGERPEETYVPIMLKEMHLPIQSQSNVVPTEDGRLVYRHQFVREDQDTKRHLVLDTEYRRVRRPGGNGNQTLLRALVGTMNLSSSRELAVLQQNDAIERLNQRIGATLNVALDKQLPANPKLWWNWWNQQNDVALQGQKQTRQTRQTSQLALVDFVPRTGGFQATATAPQGGGECFAAGTIVWTSRGRLPIEQVRVGDQVLSQAIETGELAYKSVLRTTERAPEALLRVELDGEEFLTTHGHLFWVAGEGWQQAARLDSGVNLHCVNGTLVLSDVREADAAATYNLLVEDFHTYFVGESRVLSHDVTNRKPTQAQVPGLLP